MVGAIVGAAAAAAAAAIALTGHVMGGTITPATGTVSPFGGSVPVHIARIGHIEVDLEGSGARASLQRVRCATASGTLACFVSPP
jgi:hypothetical protein